MPSYNNNNGRGIDSRFIKQRIVTDNEGEEPGAVRIRGPEYDDATIASDRTGLTSNQPQNQRADISTVVAEVVDEEMEIEQQRIIAEQRARLQELEAQQRLSRQSTTASTIHVPVYAGPIPAAQGQIPVDNDESKTTCSSKALVFSIICLALVLVAGVTAAVVILRGSGSDAVQEPSSTDSPISTDSPVATPLLPPASPIRREWQPLGDSFTSPRTNGGDAFGDSVALSEDGNTLVVGSRYDDEAFDRGGSVAVYSWKGSAWQKKGSIISADHRDQELGYSVTISSDGNAIAVSARRDTVSRAIGQVKTYLFNQSANRWDFTGQITGSDENGRFGNSISLSADGTVVAVGAPRNDLNGDSSGYVQVYRYSGGTLWEAVGSRITGDPREWLGWSVSLSGDGTLLAAAGHNYNQLTGRVQTFELMGDRWEASFGLLDGQSSNEDFGKSVILSGDGKTLGVASTPLNGVETRVYGSEGDRWERKGTTTLSADVTTINDYFDRHLALSNDGNVLVIGANQIEIYEYDEVAEEWLLIKDDILDRNAVNGGTRRSVAISGDGRTVAAGVTVDSIGSIVVYRYV